ncbi:hypothetical protein WOLCODRAFT_122186, partial [Wolfiporia cocos MD-104 SS10]
MAPRKKQKIAENAPHTDGNVAKPKATRIRAIKGKRGGLQNIPDMPLDILLEIFSCLEPKDLLNLARTSKSLRQLLMTRETISVWRAARANMGKLPDCPSFLSEPAYANLAFFPHCHRCLKSNVRTVIWEFCARYCSECKLEMFCRWSDRTRIPGISMFEALNHIETRDRGYPRAFHRSEYERVKQTWESLPDQEAKAHFEREQKERVQQTNEFSRLCRDWENSLAGERAVELEEIRRTRLRHIVSKLEEMGWGEELDKMKASGYTSLATNRHVCVPRPLTERVWKKIRDDVVEHMKVVQERRIKEERRNTLVIRLLWLSEALEDVLSDVRATAATQMEPCISDYAFMPEIRSIIESPNEREVTQETFNALQDSLPYLVMSWQADLKSQFVDLVKSKITAPEGVDVCDLAITCVRCKDCDGLLRFPSLLAHRCLRNHSSFWYDLGTNSYELIASSVMSDRRPKLDKLVIPDDTALDRFRNIVQLCKLDPATATTQDMDALDIRLSNATFRDKTWREAMHIELITPLINPKAGVFEWSLVPQSQMDELRERERADLKRSYIWCCALCVDHDSFHGVPIRKYTETEAHMRLRHDIELPSEADGDIFMHADYHAILGSETHHEVLFASPFKFTA